MAASYTNISIAEMDEFLTARGFRPIAIEGVKETVYAKRVDSNGIPLSLRVFTGIVGSNSRNAGKDAIRVVLFGKTNEGTIRKIRGTKRVHRVESWKINLGSRLDNMDTRTNSCSCCGSPMVVRKGRHGSFYGCTSFPNCRNTAKVVA